MWNWEPGHWILQFSNHNPQIPPLCKWVCICAFCQGVTAVPASVCSSKTPLNPSGFTSLTWVCLVLGCLFVMLMVFWKCPALCFDFLITGSFLLLRNLFYGEDNQEYRVLCLRVGNSTERSLWLQCCWLESSSGPGLAKIAAVWWLLGALHSMSTNESVSTSHKPQNNWCYCNWESSGSASGKGRDLNEHGKWAALFPAPSGHLWDTSVWGNLEEIQSLVAPFWR